MNLVCFIRYDIDPFQREDVLRRAVPIDHGHAETGVRLGVFRHLRKCGGFQSQIHLHRH